MRIQCPKCSQRMEVSETAAGQVVACPSCAQQMQVPAELAAAPEAAGSPAAGSAAAGGAEPTKRCPFCGETVLKVARKCKHCQETIPEGVDADSVRARLAAKEKQANELDGRGLPPISYVVGGKFRVVTLVLAGLFVLSLLCLPIAFMSNENSPFFVLGVLGGVGAVVLPIFALIFFINDLTVPSFQGRITPEKGLKAFLRGLCAKRYKFGYACVLEGDKDALVRLRPAVPKLGVVREEFDFSSSEGFKAYWKGLLHYKGTQATVSRIRLGTVQGNYAVVTAEIKLNRHSGTGFLLFGVLGAMLMGDKETLKVSKLLRRSGGQWWVVNGELDSAEDRALEAALGAATVTAPARG